MKQTIRYRFLNIPRKVTGEIRITLDDRSVEYHSQYEGGSGVSIRMTPFITLNITRPSEMDENGRYIRPPFNPNDSLTMTKFNLPVFLENLNGIIEGMKTKALYSYMGKRLELNAELAEKVRRVFTIANTIVEMAPVILLPDDESRIEGIKVKFNNENSSFSLSINEMQSLAWNLNHLDVDNLAFALYRAYANPAQNPMSKENSYASNIPKSTVDISPKTDFMMPDES